MKKPFIAENHVNVITNDKNIISYEELIEFIKKSQTLMNIVAFFTGSTQISKKRTGGYANMGSYQREWSDKIEAKVAIFLLFVKVIKRT